MIAHRSPVGQTAVAFPFEIFLDWRVLPLGFQFLVSLAGITETTCNWSLYHLLHVFTLDNITVVHATSGSFGRSKERLVTAHDMLFSQFAASLQRNCNCHDSQNKCTSLQGLTMRIHLFYQCFAPGSAMHWIGPSKPGFARLCGFPLATSLVCLLNSL